MSGSFLDINSTVYSFHSDLKGGLVDLWPKGPPTGWTLINGFRKGQTRSFQGTRSFGVMGGPVPLLTSGMGR